MSSLRNQHQHRADSRHTPSGLKFLDYARDNPEAVHPLSRDDISTEDREKSSFANVFKKSLANPQGLSSSIWASKIDRLQSAKTQEEIQCANNNLVVLLNKLHQDSLSKLDGNHIGLDIKSQVEYDAVSSESLSSEVAHIQSSQCDFKMGTIEVTKEELDQAATTSAAITKPSPISVETNLSPEHKLAPPEVFLAFLQKTLMTEAREGSVTSEITTSSWTTVTTLSDTSTPVMANSPEQVAPKSVDKITTAVSNITENLANKLVELPCLPPAASALDDQDTSLSNTTRLDGNTTLDTLFDVTDKTPAAEEHTLNAVHTEEAVTEERRLDSIPVNAIDDADIKNEGWNEVDADSNHLSQNNMIAKLTYVLPHLRKEKVIVKKSESCGGSIAQSRDYNHVPDTKDSANHEVVVETSGDVVSTGCTKDITVNDPDDNIVKSASASSNSFVEPRTGDNISTVRSIVSQPVEIVDETNSPSELSLKKESLDEVPYMLSRPRMTSANSSSEIGQNDGAMSPPYLTGKCVQADLVDTVNTNTKDATRTLPHLRKCQDIVGRSASRASPIEPLSSVLLCKSGDSTSSDRNPIIADIPSSRVHVLQPLASSFQMPSVALGVKAATSAVPRLSSETSAAAQSLSATHVQTQTAWNTPIESAFMNSRPIPHTNIVEIQGTPLHSAMEYTELGDSQVSGIAATQEVVNNSSQDNASNRIDWVAIASVASIASITGARRPSYQNDVDEISIHESETSNHEHAARDPRCVLGEVSRDLADYNGDFAPPPLDWDGMRPDYAGDIPGYISAWCKSLPNMTLNAIPQNSFEFLSGRYHVNLNVLVPPPVHPEAWPDLERSENVKRQQNCTAGLRIENRASKLEKKSKRDLVLEAQWAKSSHRKKELPRPHPNAPMIDLYLRPAEGKDVHGMAGIYNEYVGVSIAVEDHHPVLDADVKALLDHANNEKLPFIVAVHRKKQLPHISSQAATFKELVVGFAYVEGFNGLSGIGKGSSRYTARIHLYVAKDYVRKGVGRCLLDMVLQCTSNLHAAKEGYEFHNTRTDGVYERLGGNGPRTFHQLLIERPFEQDQADTEYLWMKQWLQSKFWFKEVARIPSVARSSHAGITARFLDKVVFAFCASSSEEFSAMH